MKIHDKFNIATGRFYCPNRPHILECEVLATTWDDLFGCPMVAVRVKDEVRMLDYVVYPIVDTERGVLAAYDHSGDKDMYDPNDDYLLKLRDRLNKLTK